jgi:hypothetical protein
MTEFKFFDYEPFTDGEIGVLVKEKVQADPEKGYVPGYKFVICLYGDK